MHTVRTQCILFEKGEHTCTQWLHTSSTLLRSACAESHDAGFCTVHWPTQHMHGRHVRVHNLAGSLDTMLMTWDGRRLWCGCGYLHC